VDYFGERGARDAGGEGEVGRPGIRGHKAHGEGVAVESARCVGHYGGERGAGERKWVVPYPIVATVARGERAISAGNDV